jgi:hypothetical protein
MDKQSDAPVPRLELYGLVNDLHTLSTAFQAIVEALPEQFDRWPPDRFRVDLLRQNAVEIAARVRMLRQMQEMPEVSGLLAAGHIAVQCI